MQVSGRQQQKLNKSFFVMYKFINLQIYIFSLKIYQIQQIPMQKTKQASLSTNFRYKKSSKTKQQLLQFCHFRNYYENYINQQQIHQLRKVYQHGIFGYSKSGNLVIVDRVGCIKINEINKILDEDSLIGYFNQRLLEISQCILQENDQIIWIVDLNGKIMQLASKKTISIVIKIIQNVQKYFPEILQKMYLTNTPMLFDTIFNKISDKIDQATLNKIFILSNELQPLYEDVDLSVLPDFLGGELSEEEFSSSTYKDSVKNQNLIKKQFHNKEQQHNKQYNEQDDKQEKQQFDFSSLKNALSGIKISGSHIQSVSQTPLNTEADQK